MFKSVSLPSQFRPLMLLLALGAALVAPSAFAFNSGSTGADGALAPTVNTTIALPASGILNYTTINIPAGVTVRFTKNALNTPLYLLASGNVTIAGAIAINGTSGANAGTSGDGLQADDGIPGVGGPGGFDGGRGGRDDVAQTPSSIRGGAGLGPGGGRGGIEGADSCTQGSLYQKYVGGSAGYAGAGNANALNMCGTPLTIPIVSAGVAYGSPILQPLIGGSGGGGGRGGTNYPGSGGGGGGGALLIASSGTFTLSGSINASGGNSGDSNGAGSGGPGGGGSGGAVRIVATAVAGAGGISASAGCSLDSNSATSYISTTCSVYYTASVGRIRIEGDAITYTGATSPTYVADVPGPIFLSSLPSLRIASVAGTAVPANPTGDADVVLPASLVNPVTIAFETTNVPTGNTVLFKLIPAYGAPTEVLSAAITGTTASGTTSVQVSLPQGPSTLQATTTYTVVVAMGEALSRFAQNERVEKVQLTATLGGVENQVKLITVSGKEYMVPASVLQLVGFAS